MIGYTLKDVFKNSRTEYAKEIGISMKEFNRLMGRINNGSGSPKLVTLTLEMHSKSPEMLRKIAVLYDRTIEGRRPFILKCKHSKDIEHGLSQVSSRAECASHEKRLDYLNQCAKEFIMVLESVYCGQNEDKYPACKAYNINYETSDAEDSFSNMRPCQYVSKLSRALTYCVQCPAEARLRKQM